jgi:adenylate cyclase
MAEVAASLPCVNGAHSALSRRGGRLESLYDRAGPRYMVVIATLGALAAVPFPPVPVLFLDRFHPISFGTAEQLTAIGAGVAAIALMSGILACRRDARTIHNWLVDRKPTADAESVRVAAERLPARYVGGCLAGGLALCPFAAVLVGNVLGYDLGGDALGAAAGVVVGLWAGALAFFLTELCMRPVLWDTAAALGGGFPRPRHGTSIARKIFGAMMTIGLITSAGASAISAPRGSFSHLAAGLAVSVPITFVVSLTLTTLVVSATVAPIHHLTEVTKRVREGDIDVRARAISGDELGHLTESLNAMLDGLRDRRALHAAFGSYVDPEVADRILSEGQVLGGTAADATLMFVDVVGFTSYSERVSPEQAVHRLDEFYSLVVPLVSEHRGRVNKFIGDGLLAVWGLLEWGADAADDALGAARAIVAAIDERFAGELQIGIGLNSGRVIAGTVGGGGRLEYMLIGDPVNVAQRVERLTRSTGDPILLSDATMQRLSAPPSDLERRGELSVKGKDRPLRVYAVHADVPRRAGHVELPAHGGHSPAE